MINKLKPIASIRVSYGDDGRAPKKEWLEFYCPTCRRYIGLWKQSTACDKCGTFYDWGNKKPTIEYTKTISWN